MKGDWKNPQACSYGPFSCMQSEVTNPSSALVCDACKRVIPPLAVRWSCTVCTPEWNCCTQCMNSSPSSSSTPSSASSSSSSSPSAFVSSPLHPSFPPPNIHPHHLMDAEKVYEPVVAGGASCAQVVRNALREFHARPLLGRIVSNSESFSWITYGQIGEYVEDAAWGLRHIYGDTTPTSSSVALCADNSPAYVVALLASLLLEAVVVPIHPVLDTDSLVHILEKTSPVAFFVGAEYVHKIKPVLGKVQTIIAIDKELPQVIPTTNNRSAIRYTDLKSLCEKGRYIRTKERENQNIPDLPILPLPPPPTPTTVRAILFTSGSTGMPKGAMYSEKLLVPTETSAPTHPFLRFDFQSFHPSFLLSLLQTIHLGGRRVAARSLATMMEDLRRARPSHVSATPLFWNSLMQDYNARVAEGIKKKVPSGIVSSTIRNEIEDKVAAEMRKEFGNRLRGATTGGASVSQNVLDFMRRRLQIELVDAYGSRETGGIANNGKVNPRVNVKLVDMPELGYFASGDPSRGEIAVHSPNMIAGYWNEPELNSKSFMNIDGVTYYRTGDIGEYLT